MPGNRNVQETPSGVDLPVAITDGGTGATSAEDARTALGVPATAHTHVIDDTTGLQGAIDGKAATSHTHVALDVTDLGTAATSDATDFADAAHTHAVADLTDAGTAAAADTTDFAPAAHTHVAADVTDLGELATMDEADLAGSATDFVALHKGADGTTVYYATPALAKADAISGDEIEIFGAHTITATLAKNGVNYKLASNCVLTQSSGSYHMFDDSSTGANGVVVCSISGHGKLVQAATNGIVFNIKTAGSRINAVLGAIHATGNGAKVIDQGAFGGTEVHLRVGHILPGSGTVFTLSETANYQEVEALFIGQEGSGGNGLTITLNGSSIQTISALRVSVLGDISALGSTGQQIVELGSLGSATNCNISNTTARQSIEFSAVSTSSGGVSSITQSGTGQQVIQCDILGVRGTNAIRCSAGEQYVEADMVQRTSGTGDLISVSGGTQVITAAVIKTSNVSNYAVSGTAGIQRIKGARIQNTGASGVPLSLGGQTCILESGCSLIAEAGASVSANADSAQSLKIYGTAVGNKALDGDITVQVGGVNGGTPADSFVVDADVV